MSRLLIGIQAMFCADWGLPYLPSDPCWLGWEVLQGIAVSGGGPLGFLARPSVAASSASYWANISNTSSSCSDRKSENFFGKKSNPLKSRCKILHLVQKSNSSRISQWLAVSQQRISHITETRLSGSLICICGRYAKMEQLPSIYRLTIEESASWVRIVILIL